MKPSSSIFLGLFLGSVFIAPVQAQISVDRTTNTTVTPIDNGIRIDQGDQAGGNLFHSFEQFSVPNGSEAFFNNANDIVNIFSRVTGGNISNIDGLIRANDTANLFLINPAGIIFGENASLNIGGSFLGSTADSILFPDGIEFSATDSENPPLLTINAPLGLGLEDNPGEIVNRSVVENSSEEVIGLEVAPGNDLALIGGQIDFETGLATAMGGNIELGGLSEAGTVGINSDGSFSFPEGVTKANINLSNLTIVDVRGTGGGSVTVNAGNLNLTGISLISAGIRAESTSTEAQAGDVTINVAENITLNDSFITNQVSTGGVGNSGKIVINTGSIEANGGVVDASTNGRGNAGSVDLTATGDITFDGENSLGFTSGAASLVNSGAVGNSGGVTISTNNLTLTNGGRVSASTSGEGDAGSVGITATGDITIDGENSLGFTSGATSLVNSGAVGNTEGVTIDTNNLTVTNGGQVSTSTNGLGDAGLVDITATGDVTFDGEDSQGSSSGAFSQVNEVGVGSAGGVTIDTANLILRAGGQVSASTFGRGDAGTVDIISTGEITIDGKSSRDDVFSGALSLVGLDAQGDAGGVTISTDNLTLTNGGQVSASTFDRGDAGTVDINATGDITIDGETSGGSPSGALSVVGSDAQGDAGGVTISTNNLTLRAGGRVNAGTEGRGNAGSVDLSATGDIIIDGEDLGGIPSGATSQVNSGAEGDAGGVTISTNNLTLRAGGRVDASTLGRGNAGAVNITATGDIIIDGEDLGGIPSGATSQVTSNAVGNAGGVTISTNNLTLSAGGQVDATTFGRGNAGLVNITATGDIIIDGETLDGSNNSGAFSQVNEVGVGSAGGVTIDTANLILRAGGRVDASTFGRGNAGTVDITTTGDITIDGEDSEGIPSGATSQVNSDAVGDAAGVTISTNNLTLTKGGRVDASTFGQGDAGSVDLKATGDITIDGETSEGILSGATSQVVSGAEGDAGGITISTTNLILANGRVSASTSGQGETENSGNINLRADNIVLRDNSFISARAFSGANGGNIDIDAGFVVAFPDQNNDIIANAAQGTGGNINISTNSIFGIEERSSIPANETNDIDASSEFGLDGTIDINQLDVNPVEALEELPMSLIDVVGLVAQNLCQQGKGSEFIVTGKGGVAPNPSQVRDGEISTVDLVAPATGEESEKVETVKVTGADREIEEEKEIIEAQGWIINDRGKVELVAQKTNVNGASPQPKNDKICRH